MSDPIPQSPNAMPSTFYNDAEAIRNMLLDFEKNCCVDIHWEQDRPASEAADSIVGEWNVTIEHGSRRVDVKHPEILNALWFAAKLIEAKNESYYEQQRKACHAALAKLTPEERTLLGVSMQ